MWCENCQADTSPTPGSADGASRCSRCGNRIGVGIRKGDNIQQARAILERWQAGDLLDQIRSSEELPPLVWSTELNRRSSPGVAFDSPSTSTESSAAFNRGRDPGQTSEKRQEEPQKWMPPRVRSGNETPLNERLNRPLEFEIRPPVFLRMPQNAGSTPTAPAAPEIVPQAVTPLVQSPLPEPPSTAVSFTADSVTDRGVDSDQMEQEKQADPTDLIAETDQIVPVDVPSLLADQPDQPLSSAESTRLTDRDNSARGSEERQESQLPADSAPSSQTKTNKTRALQRSSMHRRMQLPSSSSGLTSGKKPVSRKFRIDQPGDKNDEQSVLKAVRAGSSDAAAPRSSAAPERNLVSNSLPGHGRRLRIDDPEPVEKLAETGNSRTRTQGKAYRLYIDEPHASQPRGPHFQVTAPPRSNLTAMTGQFLAYLGVLGLTIGTAIVIYGHFGGYSEYTPTGWLVTTVAQMLLFLGVINLVSGGIEQNNEDVSRRINTLGEHLVRIEQVTEEVLRGPRISPGIYADPENAELQMPAREKSTIE